MPQETYYEQHREKWVEYRATCRAAAPQCVVVMCEGREEAKGFCAAHYKRWRKHGVLYSPKALAGLRSPQQRKHDYYVAHRAERLAYQQARRNADVEAARAYEREVYKRRAAKHQANNRARERKLGYLNADSLLYEAVLRKDPCSYCGEPMKHIDHIDPVALDGKNHWTNLTAACQPCNRAKWDQPLLAFLAGR
jgi:5-methylcytosine-specific restriction endonuclease McrA